MTDNSPIKSISNSYATGPVYGYDSVGGLLGGSTDVTIDNSYSSANVFGNANVGGMVGSLYAESVINARPADIP